MLLRIRLSSAWRFQISGSFRTLHYSTETLTSSSESGRDTLHFRISRAGDPRVSIAPVLDKWLEEGKDVKPSELKMIIKQLRKYRRFKHALQISEWMSEQQNHDLSPGEIAVQLDLIARVHGLEEAEKYFNSIPETLRVFQVYGALLNCYAHNKCLDKAEAIMQKMKEFGFPKSTLTYNVMLRLYSQLGKHDRVDTLMQEMEESGIDYDAFTYNIRLNAFATSCNVEGLEKLLMNMEADPNIKMDWHAYVVAANGYCKAGLIDKTITMLKRSELLIHGKTKRFAYEVLLTLYAATKSKDEVHRIFKLYKDLGRVYNSGYLCMMSSLVKLDDIDGAEKILEEWESKHEVFDLRVPNVMIGAYCRKGTIEKAEVYVDKLIKSGKELDAATWDRLANGYYFDKQMKKAVETMKKAALTSWPGWKPNQFVLAACLEYLKGHGEVEIATELLRLLKEKCHFSPDVCDRLLNDIKSGNRDSGVLDPTEGEIRFLFVREKDTELLSEKEATD